MKNFKPLNFSSNTRCYSYEDKLYYIENLDMKKVGDNLKELINAINAVDVFVVVYQNPGFLEYKKSQEIPNIRFFVLYDCYEIADTLMRALMSEFGSEIQCKTHYVMEYYDEENCICEDGIVILEYEILLEEYVEAYSAKDFPSKYEELVVYISNYAKKVNRSERLFEKNEFSL
jgi:hypothetical protein